MWLVMKQWLALAMFFTSQCTGEEGAGAGILGSFLFQFPESLICVYSELWQDWPYVIYRKVGISGCEHTEHGGNDSPVSRTR